MARLPGPFLGAAPRPELPALAPEQVERFRAAGFLVVPRFTTPEDVARIRALLLGLYARFERLPATQALDLGDEARPAARGQIPEINWTTRLVPELKRTLAFVRCGQLAEQLLGCAAAHTGYDHAIFKPPHNGRATPWHQDEAYTVDRGPFGSLTFWIPLQDVTVEMGCMQFVPGSHLGPLRPHHRRGHRPGAHALEAEGVDPAPAVACPLPVGGATVHLPRTLHYTGPNQTPHPRLAWSVEFGPPPRRRWKVF